MAEGLLRQRMPGVPTASAGTHAQPGTPVAWHAAAVMQQHGIDICAHRAQSVSGSLCAKHDLVLVMEQALKQHLLERYPPLRGRVHTLDAQDIPDPYQQPHEVFARCYLGIAKALDAWQPRLHALAVESA
jgi:protein-tyrosine-phosphatase